MSYHIQPQDNLDPSVVFDKGCAESHLKQLTHAIIYQLKWIDINNRVLEDRKAFKTPSVYPLTEDEVYEKFYKEARAEAEAIIEVERKHVVENRATHIRNTLNLAIKTLQFLVYTPRGTKGKVYTERKLIRDPRTGSFEERDVQYFESYPEGEERLNQISMATRNCDFSDYVPYMSEELKALWVKCGDLSHFEGGRVVKDAKTEKAKSESEEIPKADTRTA
jgi:hypothetical protein